MDITRLQKLNQAEKKDGNCVIYVMSRDQRVQDNFALLTAQEHSLKKEIPLVVVFNLYPKVKNRILGQYEFMIDGLKEVCSELEKLNIPFILSIGKAVRNYKLIEKEFKPEAFYFDFSPLKGPTKVKEIFAEKSRTPCYVVDTHNIVPVWVASQKEEFRAATLRPKIHRYLNRYLKEPVNIEKQEFIFKDKKVKELIFNPKERDWEEVLKKVKAKKVENYKPDFKSGSKEALKMLSYFIKEKLLDYGEKRNDPNENSQSNLSPYLHYGQLSSLRAVLEVKKYVEMETGNELKLDPIRNKSGHASKEKSGIMKGAEAFIEEIVVRKELADNFCYYNKNYDNFKGLKPWAQRTLEIHIHDDREHIYNLESLESAKTSDEAWNAAQIQLITKGKIHGYMRMYWAKRLLEWTKTPFDAIEYLVYLNDKYHLDGYDPNGYVGILWSIGGLHDRPWFEREVFGQIRYMNYNGLKRKFKLQDYIERFSQ